MKIAICTPVYDNPRFGYTKSLADLLIFSAGREFSYFTRRGSVLTVNREILADSALAWGADYLLWIDADQTFPGNALERLIRYEKPLVGCNIARREEPTGPTASKLVDGQLKPYYTSPEYARVGAVEEIAALGFGFCLMTADAVRAVNPLRFVGPAEDYNFCAKLREAGVPMFVDHGLSAEVGHITETTLTLEHMLADREKWEAMQGR